MNRFFALIDEVDDLTCVVGGEVPAANCGVRVVFVLRLAVSRRKREYFE
jgi:hypothetical protein